MSKRRKQAKKSYAWPNSRRQFEEARRLMDFARVAAEAREEATRGPRVPGDPGREGFWVRLRYGVPIAWG